MARARDELFESHENLRRLLAEADTLISATKTAIHRVCAENSDLRQHIVDITDQKLHGRESCPVCGCPTALLQPTAADAKPVQSEGVTNG